MNDIYFDLKQYFRKIDDADVCEGKGAQGIKYGGKMFAMFYKGELILKFSPERVEDLIKSKKGIPHDPGTGNPLKDKILITASNVHKWLEMTIESFEYVSKK